MPKEQYVDIISQTLVLEMVSFNTLLELAEYDFRTGQVRRMNAAWIVERIIVAWVWSRLSKL
jgi:hypothetical protein